jgi:hypothetical protein
MTHEYFQQKLGDDYHSFVYKALFYILVAHTTQLVLLFKSPKIYKNLLHKVFNMEFSVFKNKITIYFAMIIWILLLGFSAFVIKLQLNDLNRKKWEEVNPGTIGLANYHKNKWILEAELWMVMINIIETM